MTQLKQDIDTLISIMTYDLRDYPLTLGFVETADGFCEAISTHTSYDKSWEATRGQFFDADENARLALVYLDSGQHRYHGAWAEAARDFCEDEIAGVIVLDQTLFEMSMAETHDVERCRAFDILSADVAARERLFLDELPIDLWCADLPIMFDEGGVLSEYSELSKTLGFSEEFSFVEIDDLDEMDGAGNLVFCHVDWSSVMPVYDLTHTEHAESAAKIVAARLAKNMTSKCANLLRCAGLASIKNFSFFDLIEIVKSVFPGSLDLSVLQRYKDAIEVGYRPDDYGLEDRFYAVTFDRKSDDALVRFYNEVFKLNRIYQVIDRVCEDEGVGLDFDRTGDIHSIVERLRELSEAFGIAARVEALAAGVPFADVMADIEPKRKRSGNLTPVFSIPHLVNI